MNFHVCHACTRRYAYELDYCTFCRAPLVTVPGVAASVVAVTRVDAPSIGHEDTPYWCAFVRDDAGFQRILKLDTEAVVGTEILLAAAEPDGMYALGVAGTGLMGRGLVELLLARGHQVTWLGRSVDSLDQGREHVFLRMAKTMDEQELSSAMSRLVLTTCASEMGPCDIVIEAVVEELGSKMEVLARVESAMRPDAILATNTSGLPLDALADSLERPERFGALHFFNPPNRMRLVETSAASASAPEVMAALDDFVRSLGKTPVRVAQRPAFVVNRVLMPLLNEAIRALEEGAASAPSIDEAVRLGLNHPMGPLALADLIGLDVVLRIMENLVRETNDPSYEPRPMLRSLVAEGHVGRKVGQGFHSYGQ